MKKMSTGRRTSDEESFSKAIFNHDFNSAENLLPKVNIETQDYNGYTYLLNACVRNDVQVFEWLVQHGANISAQDRSSRNVIFIAIDNVSMDIIKLLNDEKRLLHTTYRGQNPLHEAVLVNQLDMVKLLVAAGLDPDDQTPSKSNAFDLAHLQHDTAILEWLLTNKSFNILDGPHDEKSEVAMLQSLFDKYGYQFLNTKSVERNLTIAEYAADMQQIEVLKWLKSKNVLPDETSPFDDARRFDDALFNHKFDVASKLLLKVDVETRDYNGNTYLMKACVNDDIEAFQWLIQSGASIDVQHKSGRNVMFIAIDNHSLDIVKWLINNKQLLSTTYRGHNPLHEAISVNGLDIVKLLVAAGIDPYHENQHGDNAFDLAQKQRDDNILKWLLTNRSFEILEQAQCEQIKIAAFENLFQKYGYQYINDKSAEKNSTIAETAARMGQIEVLLWLKSKNISVDQSLTRDIEHFRRALFNDEFTVASKLLSKINIETRYPNRNTCLMEACVNNNVNVFEWLVNNGANINVQDKSGKNLIFVAINYRSLDIVKWLTNKSLLYTIYNGNSPLHEAVLLSQLDMVKLLVDAGIDPDVQNESKTNVFDLAQTQNDKVILEWLLTNKSFKIMHAAQCEQTKIADLVNLFDKYGYQYLNLRSTERNLTIAEYAAKINEVEVLKWLKSKNILVAETLCVTASATENQKFDEAVYNHKFDVALTLVSKVDIETPDYNGNTYLMKACIQNDIEAFIWFIQRGASIEVQDKSGRNLLFTAIDSGSLDVLKWLIHNNRLLSTNYKSHNPLHEAVLAGQLDAVKLLVTAGFDPTVQSQFNANAFDLALNNEPILEWLLINKSFKIFDTAQSEQAKVATLQTMFDKYGYQYVNAKSAERNLTIAHYAANMQQVEVLKWLKSNNVQVDETLLSGGPTATGGEGFDDALFNHKFDIAIKLLPKINIEAQDSYGNTYLMKASVKNNIEAFQWLIQNGANISVQDTSGRNLLFSAIDSGFFDLVKWFVADKQLLHTVYKGRNPLHQAVFVGNLDMVKLLVGAGIDPNTQTKTNAFDLAQGNDKAILEWLLIATAFKILDEAQGEEAKVTDLENLFDKYGYQYLNCSSAERNSTVAEYVAKLRQFGVLEWLKSKHIPVDESLLAASTTTKGPQGFEDALFNHKFDLASKLLSKIDIETRDYYGSTYLMKACVQNDIEAFKWLIHNGANISVQDTTGKNLIFIAISFGNIDIVKWLVNDEQFLRTMYKGQNPLHEAIQSNHLDIVKLLVAAGVDPMSQNQIKVNAFDLAQAQGNKAILEWLLINVSFKILDETQSEEYKIVSLQNLSGKYGYEYLNCWFAERNSTLADYAASVQQFKVLKWLNSKKNSANGSLYEPPVSETASDGQGFDEALFNHKFDLALKLLPQVDLEQQDYNGNTYLMKACITNNVEAFKWLIQNGADINIKNKSGRNLIFAAIDSGSFDIIKLLIDNKKLIRAYHKGQTPLHEVILANQADVVQLLVNGGLDPNIQNQFKVNAFDLAQEQDDKTNLKWLLTNESFKILDDTQDEETKIAALKILFGKYGYQYLNEKSAERNSTISEYAADKQQIDVLWWLKSKNISVNEKLLYANVNKFEGVLYNHDFKTAYKFLSKLDINAQDDDGQTYLKKACTKDDVQVFDWLMQNGADIDIYDKAGRNLIFIAIESNCLEIVRRLVKDERFLSTTYEGQTPLHKAILTNQLEMVKLMIAAKVDPDLSNQYRVNAFDLADQLKDKQILKWLLTTRSFEILDEAESEEEKVAMLESLFSTYGFEHLNHKSIERKATIAEHAAKTEQIGVLSWLRLKNIQIEEKFKYLNIKKELINIVLLGETGVGKSTFINAFANYLNFQTLDQAENADDIQSLIPSKFTVTDENFVSREVKFGSDSNESEVPGASATQSTKCYAFETFDLKIQLFDTPGVGDTRGIGQDENNLENLLTIIGEEKNIHGICILLKPNNARINVLFEYCVKELLSRLQKDASRNIIFLFTNSRGTFYRPGDTVTPLRTILDQIKSQPPNIAIPFTQDNTFCLDNEAFRFLIAKKDNIQFKSDERENFSKSWEISAKTSMNLIAYIKSIKPHKIQDTISLNEARRIILRLCEPLAETAKLIDVNIRTNMRYKELLSDNSKDINELRELLLVPVIKLKIMELRHPMTVCTNLGCVEIVTVEGVSYKHFKKACHDHCTLRKVFQEVVGDEELMRCAAMINQDNTKVCRYKVCGHSFREHMHIYYKTEPYESTVEDKNVMSKIKKKEIDMQDIQNKINDLDATIKEYEEEKTFVQESMAKFAHFLKSNAITPYNDTYKKYIEYLIDSEKKLGDASNAELIKNYEISIDKYEQYKKTLDEQLNQAQQLDPNQKTVVNAEEVTRLVQHLFTLKHTGETISKLHGAKKTAAAAEIMESSRAMTQVVKSNQKVKQKADKKEKRWFW